MKLFIDRGRLTSARLGREAITARAKVLHQMLDHQLMVESRAAAGR